MRLRKSLIATWNGSRRERLEARCIPAGVQSEQLARRTQLHSKPAKGDPFQPGPPHRAGAISPSGTDIRLLLRVSDDRDSSNESCQPQTPCAFGKPCGSPNIG